MTVVPITLREANEFVRRHHRHNAPVQRDGGRWAISLEHGGEIVGVAIVGRAVARLLDNSVTAEVLRCCVSPAAPRNSSSMLYGRCWQVWRHMGGTRLITYNLQCESGASLRGAGFKVVAELPAAEPDKWQRLKRPRVARDVYGQAKFR